MGRPNPKHRKKPFQNGNIEKDLYRIMNRRNLEKHQQNLEKRLQEMDDKVYNELSMGVSNILAEMAQEVNDLNEEEKASEEYELLLQMQRGLKDIIRKTDKEG